MKRIFFINVCLLTFLSGCALTWLFFGYMKPKNRNPQVALLDGRYRLIAFNKCLDIRGDNKRMQIWGCGDAASKLNQKFIFTVDSSGRYTITSPSLASRCLDVNEHNNNPDQLLQMYTCGDGGHYQKWQVVPAGDRYRLQNVASGQCMRVRDDSGGDGVWVVQNGCNDEKQRDLWRIEPAPPDPGQPPTPTPTDPPPPPAASQLSDASVCGPPVSGRKSCKLKVRNISDKDIFGYVCWSNAIPPPGYRETCLPMEKTDIKFPNRSVLDVPNASGVFDAAVNPALGFRATVHY